MSVQRLRTYVRFVEQIGERWEKHRDEHEIEVEDEIVPTFPPVILIMPGMLVSGRVVSVRSYNQLEREALEIVHLEALEFESETHRSHARDLMDLFPEPTIEEAEDILEEDYEPQTIYLREVIVRVGSGETQLLGVAIELDRVLGWEIGDLST